MRQGIPTGVLPIFLDGTVIPPLRFAVPAGEVMAPRICDFVERYEQEVLRLNLPRTKLVNRNVLDSGGLGAYHLPLCPPPSDYQLLPANEIDCVACTVEYAVSAWSKACYALRVQGRSQVITAELYLAVSRRALGFIAMTVQDGWHSFSSLGDGQRPSEYRQSHPDSPSETEYEQSKEKGERILHFVQHAVETASRGLQLMGAQAHIGHLKDAAIWSAPAPASSPPGTPVPPPQVPVAPSLSVETALDEEGPHGAGPKNIKRRGGV